MQGILLQMTRLKHGGGIGMTKDIWATILNQVQTISNPIFATVNPPAAEEEIHRLERTLQVTLPTAFRDYLSIMNGQHDEDSVH
ncbi:hypothetical protein [Paenibacillus chitinolyticus]